MNKVFEGFEQKWTSWNNCHLVNLVIKNKYFLSALPVVHVQLFYWFCVIYSLCDPALHVWYNEMNSLTQYIVNPPTVWPFNIIHCGLEWYIDHFMPACKCDIMWWMHLHSIVNPPTLRPLIIIHSTQHS